MTAPTPVRILWVGGGAKLSTPLQEKLERAGYVVNRFDDGGEWPSLYEIDSYDAIVIDETASLRSGMAVWQRELQARDALPPIVVVAEAGGETAVVEAMDLGASGYVVRDAEERYLDLITPIIQQSLRQQSTLRRIAAEKRQAENALQESEKRAERSRRRSNLELTALNTVVQTLYASPEPHSEALEAALARLLPYLIRAFEFSGGLIALLNRWTGQFELLTHHGLPPPFLERIAPHTLSAPRDILHRRDVTGDPPLAGGDLLDERLLLEAGFHSYTAVPAVYQNQPLGLLVFLDTAPHPLTDGDRALLVAIGQQIGVAVENTRLFEDVVREREVACTLRDTAEAMSTTLQLDRLLERVLDELQRVVPYDAASISLIPDASLPRSGKAGGHSSVAWIVAARGLENAPAVQKEFLPGDFPLIQRVLQGRKPVIAPDVEREPDWKPLEGMGAARSWLGLPLIFHERVIGLLMIESRRPGAYDEGVADLAFAFAHQAALAIENSRLYGQTQAQLREALLLHSVTAALSSTLDVGLMLPYVARSLCEILNASSALLYSLDEETEQLTVVAEYTSQRAVKQEQTSAQGGVHSLAELPALAVALAQRRPVQIRVNDAEADPRERAMLAQRGAQAALLLPMVAHGRVAGLMAVWESQSPRRFTEGEIAIGQTLTHQAAVAMENARLFAETQKSARQIAALYETSRALSSSMERDLLIRTILEAVHHALNCEHAFIAAVSVEKNEVGVAHSIWRGKLDAFPRYIQNVRCPLDGGDILADVCRSGRTEIVETWDERFAGEIWQELARITNAGETPGGRFLHIFMPIRMRDRVIGVVEVGFDKQDKSYVTKDDIQMLAALMDQAAVALENARLFEEINRRVREVQFLHDVSLAATTGVRLEETLQGAAAALSDEMEGARVAFFLIEPESGVLRLEAGVGYHPNLIGNFRMRTDEGISGWVARHGKPVIAPDVRLDARYYPMNPDTRSLLSVPLVTGPFIIGVLTVESPHLNFFTEDDRRLLSTLASNLAVIVERARLFTEVEGARIELQQRAEALEKANAQLKELDRLKDQFFAMVNHELRTPLNSIIGFAEVLAKGMLGEVNPKQKEGLQNILASGEHLLNLINQILDFSKLRAGRMTIDPKRFDVSGLLTEVRATIAPLLEKKAQVFTLECPDQLPELIADRFRIKQVLLNLLSNANKFTPNEGRITLTCRPAGPTMLLFSVSDTGVGIKPEDQEVVFEEFRQVGGSSELNVKGTGLGLAISKRLIDLHNGRIWVESEYGRGATFSFTLPLDNSRAPEYRTIEQVLNTR